MRGCSKSSSGSWVIPIFSITRPGAGVPRHGEGDDLPEPGPLQGPAEAERLGCPLRRVAPVPERGREPPANLHAGREVRLEPGPGQPDPADERGHAGDLHRPPAEAVLVPVLAEARQLRRRLLDAHRRREVLHHPGIRVQRGERSQVLAAEAPEQRAAPSGARGPRSHEPGRRASLIPSALSSAMPTEQRVPSSQRCPMSETLEGILRGGDTARVLLARGRQPVAADPVDLTHPVGTPGRAGRWSWWPGARPAARGVRTTSTFAICSAQTFATCRRSRSAWT